MSLVMAVCWRETVLNGVDSVIALEKQALDDIESVTGQRPAYPLMIGN